MMTPNPPVKHHYIPQFMLQQWTDPVTARLQRYTRPHERKIVQRESATSEAGFEKNLYKIPGLPEDKAQLLETDFFSKIDDKAAKTHAALLEGRIADLTDAQKIAWARFIMLLMFRTPANLAAFQHGFKGALSQPLDDVDAQYAELKAPDDPATYEEYAVRHDPLIFDRITMLEFPRVALNEMVGAHLLRMHWFVMKPSKGAFLISDEPVVMQAGLAKPMGHIAVPIGPKALFLATFDIPTQQVIARMKCKDIVREVNRQVVGRASRFVAAQDEQQERFIRNHFGTIEAISIATLFADKYSGYGITSEG